MDEGMERVPFPGKDGGTVYLERHTLLGPLTEHERKQIEALVRLAERGDVGVEKKDGGWHCRQCGQDSHDPGKDEARHHMEAVGHLLDCPRRGAAGEDF